MPLHVVDGIGDPLGWLRDPLPVRKAALRLANDAGRGDSTYQQYDDRITAAAIDWLKARAGTAGEQAVGAVRVAGLPAFPADRAAGMVRSLPRGQGAAAGALRGGRARRTIPISRRSASARSTTARSTTSKLRARARRLFRPGQLRRRQCRQADARRWRRPASPARRACSIRADHGDNLGTRAAVGQIDDVRGIGRGADDPRRAGCAAGLRLPRAGVAGRCVPDRRRLGRARRRIPADRDLPGASLFDVVARDGAAAHDPVANTTRPGAATGAFMIRKGRFKYVYYAGMPPQLFDLEADPQETPRSGARARLSRARRRLRDGVAPGRRSRSGRRAGAKPTRRARIAAFGGREAILKRGSFGYSPAPGTTPVYS